MNSIEVSIICNAYNHEAYIGKALESFVNQKTNFAFEILVHDDASTDGTAAVIREYESKYPELIKPIYQTENQWSKGQGIVGKLQRSRALGRYIAMCEGDDYFTDPYKLQKQFDALEAHPEIDFCAHKTVAVDALTGEVIKYISPSDENRLFTVEEIIAGGGDFVATNSIMYRKSINDNVPHFREVFRFDYALQIHAGLRGGMIYLPECMSAYRMMVPGSWSETTYSDNGRILKHINKQLEFLKLLNEETELKYDGVIQKCILEQEFMYLKFNGDFKKLKQDKFKKMFKERRFVERAYINAAIAFPPLIKIKKLLKKR